MRAGRTYDEVRRALIEFMAEQRERVAPSGNHAGHAGMRMAKHDEHRYMSNATEALAELMRLGWVHKAPLPTARSAAALYKSRKFALTEEGNAWVDLLSDSSQQQAYDVLLRELWRAHPQLGSFLRLVSQRMLVVPTANWREVHPDKVAAGEGREAYMRFLARRGFDAVESGTAGWAATFDEIHSAIRAYIDARLEAAARRRKIDPYPRSRDFVGACEEALVSFAFRSAGAPMDYISHEIIRRWTKTLGVSNFSYHVPAAPALRIWGTAELDLDDAGNLTAVHRRTVASWGDSVIDELPGAYELARRRTPGNSWIPIYRVRATVCSRLGIGERIFDRAVIEHLQGTRRPDAPFTINLDPSEYGSTPPTERPLEVPDRSGRARVFRVLMVVPKSRKESS